MKQCQECKRYFKEITNTHLAAHNLSIEDYIRKYPGEEIRIGIRFEKGRPPWNKGIVFVNNNYYTRPGYYEKYYKKIRERDNNQCAKCNAKENLVVHHKIPMPLGKHIDENLITLCRSCHSKTYTKKLPHYRFVAEKTMDVEAGHYLKDYNGLCKQQHGHNYVIKVKVGANELNEQGMVIDFSELKTIILDVVMAIDHQNLNDVFDFNPTAENMAWYIYYSLQGNIEGLLSVEVFETPTSSITYTQYEVE